MPRVRQRTILKAMARQWTPFAPTTITDKMRDEFPFLKHCAAIYANSRFEVHLFVCATSIGGVMQMNVRRHGDLEVISWEEIQRIKLELFGPEATAVEVYPTVVDEWKIKSGIRVVWILPTTWPLPFGLEKPNAWGRPTE